MDREEKMYRLAKKKVKQKKGFYMHLLSYVFVNIALFLVILLDQGFYDAFPVPIFWGIGLAFHYVNVFGMPGGKMTEEWEQNELAKEYDKLQDRSSVGQSDRLDLNQEELDLDDHLELRRKEPLRDYDDKDFV